MNTAQQPDAGRRADAARDPIADHDPVILVVDDDERNLFAMAESLRNVGHVMVARSGREALKHLLRHDFAVVLLDVLMPQIDGYETAGLIRARERTRHLPIIFLTAVNKEDSEMLRGYEMGAVDYVFKPVDMTVLRSKVSVFVELFKKTREIQKTAREQQMLLEENLRIRTEKLLAEQALRRSEERQSVIVRSLPLVLYAGAPGSEQGAPEFISDNVEELCGFSPREFLGGDVRWADRIHPDDRARVLDEFAALAQHGFRATEYRWRRKDGEYRVFLDQSVLVRDENGTPKEIVGTLLDVTTQRQLEQQLVQAQKLDAIGKLTGGIAHDFNNMLTVVISCLDRLKRTCQEDAVSLRRIDMALTGALRCTDMTRQLLTFARHRSLKPERADLNAMVRGIGDMVRRIIGDHIELEIACAPGICPVEVDLAQAESALLNLVVNARDAMPNGGRLTIATACETARGAEAVKLIVRDTGVGIPKEILGRVFEPFFTTKDPGKGTGLGLSMIYGFVKASSGNIAIDSSVGDGTTVTIDLPRAKGECAAAPEPADETATELRARAGETVLVVEDDDAVREVAVGLLAELGYDVRTASNAVQALEMVAAGAKPDLVFTDLVMPGGMTGHDLAAKLQTLSPGLKVLITSAHTDQLGAASAPSAIVGFLHKPYRQNDLAAAVRQALDVRIAV